MGELCLAPLLPFSVSILIPRLLSGEHVGASLISGTQQGNSGHTGHQSLLLGSVPSIHLASILATNFPLKLRMNEPSFLFHLPLVCPLPAAIVQWNTFNLSFCMGAVPLNNILHLRF